MHRPEESASLPTDSYLAKGRAGQLVATVVGCLVGLILFAVCLGGTFYASRSQWRRSETTRELSFVRVEPTREREEEEEEKPELVEVSFGGDGLGKVLEDAKPLSLSLLSSLEDYKSHPTPPARAVVSFLVLLPSPSPSRGNVGSRRVFTSIATSAGKEELEERLELAFGSLVVLLEGEVGERSRLLLLGRQGGE